MKETTSHRFDSDSMYVSVNVHLNFLERLKLFWTGEFSYIYRCPIRGIKSFRQSTKQVEYA